MGDVPIIHNRLNERNVENEESGMPECQKFGLDAASRRLMRTDHTDDAA